MLQLRRIFPIPPLHITPNPLAQIDWLIHPCRIEEEFVYDRIVIRPLHQRAHTRHTCAIRPGYRARWLRSDPRRAAKQPRVIAIVIDIRPDPGESAKSFPRLPMVALHIEDQDMRRRKPVQQSLLGISLPSL